MRAGTVFNRNLIDVAATLNTREETNGFVVIHDWKPAVKDGYRCEQKKLLNRNGHCIMLTRYLEEYHGQFQMYWDLTTKSHPLPEWMSTPIEGYNQPCW